MPQQMMDEFLARQEFYEKFSNPKMEAERIKPPLVKPSKLKEDVHEARRRYKLVKSLNDKENQPIKSIHPVKEEIELANAFLFCLFFLVFGMMYQSC